MMKRHDVTITDISKQMGLSVYTVSRALNGLTGVSEKTRAAVLETARTMGHIPNVNARDLRTGTHRFVTLLTAGMSNSYYLDLIDGIESVLQDKKESLFIADMAVNGRYSRENETNLLRQVVENRPGGIISTLGLSEDSRSQLKNWNIPIVFVDSTPGYSDDEEVEDGFSYVATDNVDAAAKLGRHLGVHHFKRWLLAIYPDTWNSRFARENGLLAAADECEAEIRVLECGNNREEACAAIHRFLDRDNFEPDVIIAGNNPILLGVMSALSERGIDVPQDLALVAFDDFAWSDLLSPKITLVAEDSRLIGAKAANYLLEQMEGREEVNKSADGTTTMPKPIHDMIETSLKIRESCGCICQ
ncbi:Transcriptional regulator, LacI family [Bifidobacterium reuteri DSM 23975]|uniref:Transcriptional regulator, LacI family n=1 Tax=Bifidobacterium reuteri DSM 23975 TaxID=1437610 RepID=A0A087CT43_9BIFI|nr:LacI family DNA-binding transcriptional regulator [Bifidobacterium reuteri]KFI86443.1 Transcriptional regulator, LacI family [Bifidobacterium reuteri DSM 23975]